MVRLLLLLASFSALAGFAENGLAGAAEIPAVSVDFSRITGPVKPVNGVGQPPMVGKLSNWPMFHYLKEAGIPFSRLHDVDGWLGGGMYVDIPNLFPTFEADENDAGNYRFAFTDNLVSNLIANGVRPFFRLGVTIENWVGYGNGLPPMRIVPPKDALKWARICEHVIRHYTEGWADGFKYDIAYWEIWNEPDNHEDVARNCMWSGDWKSYCDFYGVVAPYLKAKFPRLKIGGYASCGFYAGVGVGREPAANSSSRTRYFVECAETFLQRAQKEKWPLDFFSYHSYSPPKEALRQVDFADELLNAYGFTRDRTERIFNEWLVYPRREFIGTAKQAAGIAAVLAGLQNGPCDVACIYDARCDTSVYSPLFHPLTQRPRRAYYSFVAFNELKKLGNAAYCTSSIDGLWVAAATDMKGRAAVLLANDTDRQIALPETYNGLHPVSARVIDRENVYRVLPYRGRIGPHAVLLLEFNRNSKTASNRVSRSGVLLLTFDDCSFAEWESALPIFEKYDAHATFFVSREVKGGDAEVLRRILDAGHAVGLHGKHHRNADEQVAKTGVQAYYDEEIAGPEEQVGELLITVDAFAYPNNRHNDMTDEFLLKRFKRLRAGVPGATPYDPKGIYQKGRRCLQNCDDAFLPADELKNRRIIGSMLIGEAYQTNIDEVLKCIERVSRRDEAVAFTSHGIRPDAKGVSMKSEWLEAILRKAQECGVKVLSFDQLDDPECK